METDPNTGKPAGAGCPDPDLVALAGVSFDEINGGAMPSRDEHIYHWQTTQGGFTVLFFTAVIMAAAFFVGPEVYAAIAEGGYASVGISGAEAASYVGSAYAGGTLLTTGRPASLTDVKNGVFGAVGDGTRGVANASSQLQKEAGEVLAKRHVRSTYTLGRSCDSNEALCTTQEGLNASTPDPGHLSEFEGASEQKSLRAMLRYCMQLLKLPATAPSVQACAVPPNPPVALP